MKTTKNAPTVAEIEKNVRDARACAAEAIDLLALPLELARVAAETARALAVANLRDQDLQVAFAKADAKHARLQSMVDVIRGALETEV